MRADILPTLGAAAAIFSLTPAPAAVAQQTGVALYATCKNPFRLQICRAYIAGFIAALRLVNDMTGDNPVACLSASVGIEEALTIFRRFGENDPTYLNRTAALALGAALSQAFPGKTGVPCGW
jgi:hypothetical protein